MLWWEFDLTSGLHTILSPKGDTSDDDRVICRDFLDPERWLDGSPLYTLTRDDLQWFRVVGLFEKNAHFN